MMKAAGKPRPHEGLERAYERNRRPMLRAARTWFPALRGYEQDLYQGAWASLLRDPQEREERDLEKRLAHAVYWQGLQELRRRRRRPAESLDAVTAGNGPNGDGAGAADIADARAAEPAEQAEIRAMGDLAREVIADLTPRQQTIVKVQWGWGLPRAEVAALLGLSERQVKRELEDAAPVIARNVELVNAERWCESRRSLVVAYAFQVLSARRTAMAEHHLENCPGCRQLVRAVGQRLDGLAAVAPAGLALEPPAERALPHVAAPFEWARTGIADLGASAKQQLTSLLARTPAGDSGAVQIAAGGGLRGSGGTAAAVVACIAVSGGATYCAVDGVPEPFRKSDNVSQPEKPKRERQRSRARIADEQAAQTLTAPTATPAAPADSTDSSSGAGAQSQAPTTTPAPAEQPPPPPPDEAAPSPAPAGGAEFGNASAGAQPSSRPAPAPTGGGGEFGP